MKHFTILLTPVSKITMRETIKIVIYTINILSQSCNSINAPTWKILYKEFYDEFNEQMSRNWPQLTFKYNSSHNCICIDKMSSNFIESYNILTLLFRLLCIEIQKSINYPDLHILNHKLNNDNNNKIKNISLYEIFDILIQHLNYYKSHYNDVSTIEYKLVEFILVQL